MRLRSIGAGAAFVALLGCAAPQGALDPQEVCLRRFADYDRAVRLFASPGSDEGVVVGRNVGPEAQRLIEEGCVTRDGDLDGLGALERSLRGTLTGESGAAIDPVWLHVGVVPGFVSEFQARSFFGDLGYRVRSIGAPTLGRRIFIGPFTTEGGLAEAVGVAEAAGFIAPYPRRFGT